MDPDQQALRGEVLHVSAQGDGGDPELLGQLAEPHRSPFPDLAEYEAVAVLDRHAGSFGRTQTA
ncbi:hypothetical protein GCM10009530_61750 [Microbispora corallina]|uniref:Uncharacterized protein n=1 Tax=Microbispora corallina TaxID=83302 RepID=A0ABQ4G8H7_9ACTN|nr:hypothetical protein Mco01_63600 [Microbispora corallina]